MLIYSIVQTVQPGTLCSYPVGRCEVEAFDDRQRANETCDTFNRCCHTPGIVYSVEAVDEESPDRVPTAEMLKAAKKETK
jgi:hypothetical protein